MTLCNMVVEAGGKNGIVAADRTTYKYLEVVGINQIQCPLCSQFHYLCLLSESNLVMYVYVFAYYSHLYIHARGKLSI